ncbi:MAG: GNAT family N-acetyltransferase [Rubrobacter sp.]|jgi:RimJ/RimL family protein N-acetyltransferase|nr:GNAT family N-acetyltransferase [Rubrobacter sp.]
MILKDFPDAFETERLLIRRPAPGDGAELFAAIKESLAELEPWMAWVHFHKTPEDSEKSARRGWVEFLERKDLRMHLFSKGTDTLVGSSGLHRIEWEVPRFEIGYWLRTSFTGRGYMTEAVRGIAAFAFEELGAKRVEIKCDPTNTKSVAVAERCGFHLEGELRNNEKSPGGELRNTLVFSMLPEESRKLRGPR